MTDVAIFTGAICGSGNDTLLESEPAGERWCFAERKRLPHTWELWGSLEPSWYEPVWICRLFGLRQRQDALRGRLVTRPFLRLLATVLAGWT